MCFTIILIVDFRLRPQKKIGKRTYNILVVELGLVMNVKKVVIDGDLPLEVRSWIAQEQLLVRRFSGESFSPRSWNLD